MSVYSSWIVPADELREALGPRGVKTGVQSAVVNLASIGGLDGVETHRIRRHSAPRRNKPKQFSRMFSEFI